jgi:hypothetical protein
VHNAHIECVTVRRIAPQGILGDQGAYDLLVVGLDENAVVHLESAPQNGMLADFIRMLYVS